MPPASRTASANLVAHTSSQIRSAHELLGSRLAATCATSLSPMRPPTSASIAMNSATPSNSSTSKTTTEPSTSLPMKIRSRTRTVPESTRAFSSGAIFPVNLFPGNPTTRYSTGPIGICGHPYALVRQGYKFLQTAASPRVGDCATGRPRLPSRDPGPRSDATPRNDTSIRDGCEQRVVVALILVGIGLGERTDGLVEGVRRSQVGGDGDPIARAGVGPGQGRAAELTVGLHSLGDHLVHVG